MKLSIIIPTLNENKLLPILLKSIKKQNFKDYEIIVADGGSVDDTIKIAKSFGCKIVKESNSPGNGRNKGAKIAKGEYLLFLDSDVILPNNFLNNIVSEFAKRKLGIASCYIKPLGKNIFDHLFYLINNILLYFIQFFIPHGMGFCLFIKRNLHELINGFNEKMRIGEDHDYCVRASKLAKFRMLSSSHILVSVRRFEKEGRLKLIFKYLKSELYFIFTGKIPNNVYEYEFGNYSDKQQ